MIDVLIPTFGRADRLAAVAENVHEATSVEHRVVFIIEADDEESHRVRDQVETASAIFIDNTRSRNYAGACNLAYVALGVASPPNPYLFAGADDLNFHPGWAEKALERMNSNPHTMVVGTDDTINPYVARGLHATHYLVAREYLDRIGGTVDGGPGSFFHEGYSHNYTDTELVGTAKARARFLPCLESVVEHMHHGAGKSQHDATYALADEHYAEDSALYDARRTLWQDLSR